MVDSWNELIDNADLISEDVLEVIEVLSKAKDNEKISGLIVVLDHIEIDKYCYFSFKIILFMIIIFRICYQNIK